MSTDAVTTTTAEVPITVPTAVPTQIEELGHSAVEQHLKIVLKNAEGNKVVAVRELGAPDADGMYDISLYEDDIVYHNKVGADELSGQLKMFMDDGYAVVGASFEGGLSPQGGASFEGGLLPARGDSQGDIDHEKRS